MQLADEIERALRVRRALHVHAHEFVNAHSVIHQFRHQTECKFLANVEAHVRQLETDVGVQFAGGDLVQQVVI